MADLAARQAALIAALVSGAPVHPGFDAERLSAAGSALLRKRASGVAREWPLLASGCGARWPLAFTGWAAGRTPAGALRDGWDFARHLHAAGRLSELARVELANREALMHYDGHQHPRRRRLPAVRRVNGVVVVAAFGRTYRFRRSTDPGTGW